MWAKLVKVAVPVIAAAERTKRRIGSRPYLKQQLKAVAPAHSPIRVGFIAQMAEVWDKQKLLFEQLSADERFRAEIIYVDRFDFVNKQIIDTGDEDFYVSLYGREKVRHYGDGTDVSPAEYDYLFYERPYNHFLPETLRTFNTIRHSRICMVNYSPRDWKGGFGYSTFAPDVHIWFASNETDYRYHAKAYGNDGLRKCYLAGYPAFELYRTLPTEPGKNRILWTPRWSYDEGIGGSHFFEYIDRFIELAEKHPEITLTIRPHPLMFENLISKKLLNRSQEHEIRNRCAKAGIRFDQNRMIAVTFTETDILVTDYSSIVSLFLATGKPAVYCPGDVPVNEWFERLTGVMYNGDSWEAIESALHRLTQGEDELQAERNAVVEELLFSRPGSAARMADILFDDFHGKEPKAGVEERA